jgi:hypothetical protein
MKKQGSAVSPKSSKRSPGKSASGIAKLAKPSRSTRGLSARFLEAREKYPRGHPALFRATIEEFRGKFEPEFWEAVREVRLLERRRLQIE